MSSQNTDADLLGYQHDTRRKHTDIGTMYDAKRKDGMAFGWYQVHSMDVFALQDICSIVLYPLHVFIIRL